MRAGVAAVAILVILASPLGLEAFLPGDVGPVHAPSPAGRAPPSPQLFSHDRTTEGTRGPSSGPLIVEVFYDAVRDDEYIIIANPTAIAFDLAGWRLTDREGTIEFPAMASLQAGARAVIARNATSYFEDTLDVAEYTYGAGDAIAMIVVGRIPQLNNDGDEVLLLDPAGTVVDAFAYGSSSYGGEGWTGPGAWKVPKGKRAVRALFGGSFLDGNTASDWDSPRSYGLGQSELPLRRFEIDGTASGFLSPDDSLSVLESLLDRGTASIHAGLYTLTNPVIAESLRAAASRGVEVKILLEGGPVGGIDEREWDVASRIVAAGGSVRFIVDDYDQGIVARYRFLHAKYAVIDGRTLVAGSENWGEHGFPSRGGTGNRGWNVAIEDLDLAAYFEDLFEQDFNPLRRDSVPLSVFAPNLYVSNDTASNETYRFAVPSSRFIGRFAVTPVIAPEHALREDAVLALIGSATMSLEVEEFYVSRRWAAGPNLYLEAAIDTARRGVSVRILLDGTWYNVEGDDPVDNDDTAAYVNGIARREGIPLEARVVEGDSRGLAKIHNKGILVDGRIAFVSSLNWNRNAATNNREVGLIVEGAEIVTPFRIAFEHDWSGGGRPGSDPMEILGNPLLLPLLTLFVVNVAILAAWRRSRRRRGKGLSEEEPTQ